MTVGNRVKRTGVNSDFWHILSILCRLVLEWQMIPAKQIR
jgi:hypothetical protein